MQEQSVKLLSNSQEPYRAVTERSSLRCVGKHSVICHHVITHILSLRAYVHPSLLPRNNVLMPSMTKEHVRSLALARRHPTVTPTLQFDCFDDHDFCYSETHLPSKDMDLCSSGCACSD